MDVLTWDGWMYLPWMNDLPVGENMDDLPVNDGPERDGCTYLGRKRMDGCTYL